MESSASSEIILSNLSQRREPLEQNNGVEKEPKIAEPKGVRADSPSASLVCSSKLQEQQQLEEEQEHAIINLGNQKNGSHTVDDGLPKALLLPKALVSLPPLPPVADGVEEASFKSAPKQAIQMGRRYLYGADDEFHCLHISRHSSRQEKRRERRGCRDKEEIRNIDQRDIQEQRSQESGDPSHGMISRSSFSFVPSWCRQEKTLPFVLGN